MPMVSSSKLVNAQEIKFIRVKNDSEFKIGPLPFDGSIYYFNPGEEMVLPESIYYFWMGQPKPDAIEHQKEKDRCKARWSREKLVWRKTANGQEEAFTKFPVPLKHVGDAPTKQALFVGGELQIPGSALETAETEKLRQENKDLKTQNEKLNSKFEDQIKLMESRLQHVESRRQKKNTKPSNRKPREERAPRDHSNRDNAKPEQENSETDNE